MEENESMETFAHAPVPEAVMKNALPAMVAMLMVMVYNLADTFFIGQTQDALQVAAVSLATPVFLVTMAFGTVFGVGGTSVISRALGEGRGDFAKKVSSFCMWGSVIVGIVWAAFMIICANPILSIIGASADTWDLAKDYLLIVAFASPFLMISSCFSNIVRADGQPGKAMVGMLVGNILNIVLDPIFILGLNMGCAGAAVATVIGNAVGAVYYIVYFLRGKSNLSIHPRDFSMSGGVFKGVMAIGIPAALGSALMSVSQVVVNAQMAVYGDMAIAAIGVAMKVTMISGVFTMGLGQGVQPLLGYCVGAKLWQRFKDVMKFSLILGFVLSLLFTGLCYLFVNQIVGAFLVDQTAFSYAVQFAQILLCTSFLFGIFFVIVGALQAMGAGTESLIVNISRQGIIFIPAVFILGAALGMTGLVWAQPVADVLSLVLAVALYMRGTRKAMATEREESQILSGEALELQ